MTEELQNPLEPDVSLLDMEEGKYKTVQDHPMFREGDEGILAVKIPFLFSMEKEGRMKAYLCIRETGDLMFRPIQLRVQEMVTNADGSVHPVRFSYTLNYREGSHPHPEWWKGYIIMQTAIMAFTTFPEEWDTRALGQLIHHVRIFHKGVYRHGAEPSERISQIVSHIRKWAGLVLNNLSRAMSMLRRARYEEGYLNFLGHLNYKEEGNQGRPIQELLYDFDESADPTTEIEFWNRVDKYLLRIVLFRDEFGGDLLGYLKDHRNYAKAKPKFAPVISAKVVETMVQQQSLSKFGDPEELFEIKSISSFSPIPRSETDEKDSFPEETETSPPTEKETPAEPTWEQISQLPGMSPDFQLYSEPETTPQSRRVSFAEKDALQIQLEEQQRASREAEIRLEQRAKEIEESQRKLELERERFEWRQNRNRPGYQSFGRSQRSQRTNPDRQTIPSRREQDDFAEDLFADTEYEYSVRGGEDEQSSDLFNVSGATTMSMMTGAQLGTIARAFLKSSSMERNRSDEKMPVFKRIPSDTETRKQQFPQFISDFGSYMTNHGVTNHTDIFQDLLQQCRPKEVKKLLSEMRRRSGKVPTLFDVVKDPTVLDECHPPELRDEHFSKLRTSWRKLRKKNKRMKRVSNYISYFRHHYICSDFGSVNRRGPSLFV